MLLPGSPRKKRAKIEGQYSDLHRHLHNTSSSNNNHGNTNSSDSCIVVPDSLCDEESDPPGFFRSAAGVFACASDPSESPLRTTGLTQERAEKDQLPDDFLEPLPITAEGNDLCNKVNFQSRISRADHHYLLPSSSYDTKKLPSQLHLGLTVNHTTNRGSRQFWKAGDYDGPPNSSSITSVTGIKLVLHLNRTVLRSFKLPSRVKHRKTTS
jgi:hypothetical protein